MATTLLKESEVAFHIPENWGTSRDPSSGYGEKESLTEPLTSIETFQTICYAISSTLITPPKYLSSLIPPPPPPPDSTPCFHIFSERMQKSDAIESKWCRSPSLSSLHAWIKFLDQGLRLKL